MRLRVATGAFFVHKKSSTGGTVELERFQNPDTLNNILEL